MTPALLEEIRRRPPALRPGRPAGSREGDAGGPMAEAQRRLPGVCRALSIAGVRVSPCAATATSSFRSPRNRSISAASRCCITRFPRGGRTGGSGTVPMARPRGRPHQAGGAPVSWRRWPRDIAPARDTAGGLSYRLPGRPRAAFPVCLRAADGLSGRSGWLAVLPGHGVLRADDRSALRRAETGDVNIALVNRVLPPAQCADRSRAVRPDRGTRAPGHEPTVVTSAAGYGSEVGSPDGCFPPPCASSGWGRQGITAPDGCRARDYLAHYRGAGGPRTAPGNNRTPSSA